MSRSLVPEPEFFQQHKRKMNEILEKAKTEIYLFKGELADCIFYMERKIRECEMAQQRFEQLDVSQMDAEELEEFRKEYNFNRAHYMELVSARKSAYALEDQKRQIEEQMTQLLQYAEASNHALDLAMARYEDAR